MTHTSTHLILPLTLLAIAASTAAIAQSSTQTETIPISGGNTSWQAAQQFGSSQPRLLVVTLDEPHHRHSCRVESFTLEKLVCSRAIGGPRTYFPQQVLTLTIPGDGATRVKLLIGLNAAIGAAIWGTVVLAAACPACAAGTAAAALLLFCAAGAISIGDGQSERLIYTAPGHDDSDR
jgi:hypothetical protein